MNEKDLYRDFNNIIIDEHEFDNIDVCMTDIQKSQLKSNLKKSIKTRRFMKSKITAAIAAILVLLIGIGYTNPALAAQIPILNPIVKLIGYTGEYDKYSDIINKTITCSGKSFTINSVVCYDNIIIIGYTVKSDTKIDITGPMFFPIYMVNGKWLNTGSTGPIDNIDDNTAIGSIQLVADTMTLPDKFKFEMSFKTIDGTPGNWDFKFNISKSELSKYTKVYKPNQVVKYGNYDFTVDKVTLTPLSTIISWHSKSEQQTPNIPIILDDKGNELTYSGAGGTDCNGNYYTTFLPKVDINTKYLSYVPYNDTGSGFPGSVDSEIISVPLDIKLPVELSQGKIGKIVINKIDFSDGNDKVNVQGVLYGKLPELQASAFSLEHDNDKADVGVSKHSLKKIGTDKYQIIREYTGLKNDKNYRLTTGNMDNAVDYDSKINVILK